MAWMVLAVAVPSIAAAQQPPPSPLAKPKPRTVGEVVVTGQAPAVQTSIDRKSYSVSGDLQAETGSIADALRKLPSVEVDVQGAVSLRGDPNVTILIDGKASSLFQGDNRGQALQQLPADQIERVEVITNPSAEFRAEGSGGVINLISKKAKGAGPAGSARLTAGNAGRAVAGASGGYNSKALSLAGDLTYRHDSQKQASVEERQRLDAAAGGFDDIRQDQIVHLGLDTVSTRGSFDYDVDPRTRIGGELRGNFTAFHLKSPSRFQEDDVAGAVAQVFDRQLDIRQQRANEAVSANLRRKFAGEGHQLTVSLSYETTNDDRVRSGATSSLVPVAPDAFDQQRLNYDQRRTELKADYVRPMGERATLKAGIDLQFDDNAYANRGFRGAALTALAPDPTLSNLFLYRQSLDQAYVTYERPFGRLIVLAGLRLEDVRIDLDLVTQGQKGENDYVKAYPSLHLAWRLSDSQQLTASYSHRVQRPDPLEFNAFRFLLDPLNFRAGNPDLKPQETHSYELGFQDRQGGVTNLATLFYRENVNGVADVIRDLGNGIFLSTRESVSQSRSAGLELATNGRLSKTLTYNLSANAYWTQIDPQPLGSPKTRSAFTGFGRASLSWQATGSDLVQLNAFLNSERLTPQGHIAPTGALNLGYRHKLTDKLALIVTAQDLLGTVRFRQVIDTPLLKSHLNQSFDSRLFQAGFVWTFGGGRSRDPGFDFQAAPSPQ
jgi:outer membrane receptor protein involved in Fe transport